MNIFETRRSDGFIISIKSYMSNTLRKKGVRQNIFIFIENELNYFGGMLILGVFLSGFFGLIAFTSILIISTISPIYKYNSEVKKIAPITIAFSSHMVMIKSKILGYDFKITFKPEEIEQFFIHQLDNKMYCLSALTKKNNKELKFPIIVGNQEKLPEFHDIIKAIHNFYNIDKEAVEGSLDVEQTIKPKRKREYFKIFDQNIDDIRKNGVITISGVDYHISDTEQTDWQNGLISYRFKLEENLFLFYQPSVTNQLLIKEESVSYLYDLELYTLENDLSNLPPIIDIKGISFYQSDTNKGEYFLNDELIDQSIYQALYEDENNENYIRLYLVNGRILASIGTIIHDHQLNDILPEIED